MNRPAARRAMIASALAAAALVAGANVSAMADVSTDAAPTSISVARVAGLYGAGAVIMVDLEAKCPADADYAYLNVRVSQLSDFGTTTGEWSIDIRCTGTLETRGVPVAGWSPFATGEAFVTAELQTCSFECTSVEAVRTVRVEAGTQEVRRFRSHDLRYQLPRTGEIQAGGAGAVVLVPYTCSPGMYGGFDAMLAQSSGDGYVNFSNDTLQLTCTATNRTGVLAFHANGGVWTPGPSFLHVTGYICPAGESPCRVGTTFRTTKLV